MLLKEKWLTSRLKHRQWDLLYHPGRRDRHLQPRGLGEPLRAIPEGDPGIEAIDGGGASPGGGRGGARDRAAVL